MPVVTERDPVLILDRIRKMILDIIAETADTVIYACVRLPLAAMQKELDDLKYDLPINYKNAAGEDEKEKCRQQIGDKEREIADLRRKQDEYALGFLYAQQGVQQAFNAAMSLYGAGVNVVYPPNIMIKGNGNISIQANQSNQIYVARDAKVGTPSPAVIAGLDGVEIAVKAGMKVSKWGKTINDLKTEGEKIYRG